MSEPDYGKLAYMKVEDLERRVYSPSPAVGVAKLSAAVGARLNAPMNIGSVTAPYGAAAMIKLTFDAPSELSGTVSVRVGGMTLATIGIDGKGRIERTAVCSLTAETESEIVVLGSGGLDTVRLVGVEAVFVGARVVASDSGSVACASSGDRHAAAVSGGGVVKVTPLYPDSGEVGTPITVAPAVCADIKATEDGYLLVACGEDGTYVVALDEELNTRKISLLTERVESVAVYCGVNSYAVAVVVGGAVKVAPIDGSGARNGEWSEVAFPSAVDRVGFASGDDPILVIESGGKCFLKSAERSSAEIGFKVVLSLAAVSI